MFIESRKEDKQEYDVSTKLNKMALGQHALLFISELFMILIKESLIKTSESVSRTLLVTKYSFLLSNEMPIVK